MGCKILVTPESKAPLQGQIAGTSLQSPTIKNGANSFSKVAITFVNPNPVSVRLNGTVEARNANGEVVAKGKIAPEKALVLVGAKRELWAQLDKVLPSGTYQIKAAIDYGGKEMVGGALKATVEPSTVQAPQATIGVLPESVLSNL